MKESLTKKFDFIVIGAGIAGLSCAYHLTKDGYSVMVLDKSDGKDNASYASTAEMNHDPDASWDRIISKFGIRGQGTSGNFLNFLRSYLQNSHIVRDRNTFRPSEYRRIFLPMT